MLYFRIFSQEQFLKIIIKRWFADKKTLETISTTSLVEIDLNAIFYKNEITLHNFFNFLAANSFNNATAQQEYTTKAQQYLTNARNYFFIHRINIILLITFQFFI